MPSAPPFLVRVVPAVERVSPRVAGDLAYRLFFSTRPRMPVRSVDAATHDAAGRGCIRVRDAVVTTYAWGTGPRTVLLLHGWRGRASQFAPLVRELVAEGFRVVAFDAPAHGSSGGRGTDIRDWVAAAEELRRTDGPFAAIVGHSFGGLAALTIARTSGTVRAVAVIAGAAAPDAFLASFVRDLRAGSATATRLRTRFHRRLGLTAAAITAGYDAAAHPLPAPTELLVVHDRDDRRMPDGDALRLHAAHRGRSRLLRTERLGHTKILAADPTLDAVVALVTGGLDAVDALGTTVERSAGEAAPPRATSAVEGAPPRDPHRRTAVRRS
ncbi:alpha/beta fold hydrolase [Microbacterium sp. BLY]|uniref:alpha/beta fold hydrolase n=1 Tax=Microbacterium sp. BLY TaxID=2823280 RepID=UPI001B33AA45|nr:alpha/beta hydrolase [Microbacterium sp. BLY]MBP3976704.1 alpha/beta hydrolase [Microbacterium sp. BLY]